mmetsp:Transcript_55972/g.131189  ORF Transcript_55972/g.131189 Transcript_55972/m.131189 type:complete len:239 (-) Transcript_55972:695-1411(-)
MHLALACLLGARVCLFLLPCRIWLRSGECARALMKDARVTLRRTLFAFSCFLHCSWPPRCSAAALFLLPPSPSHFGRTQPAAHILSVLCTAARTSPPFRSSSSSSAPPTPTNAAALPTLPDSASAVSNAAGRSLAGIAAMALASVSIAYWEKLGRRPSTSVHPKRSPSQPDDSTRPPNSFRSRSAARLAIPRPTKRGVSEAWKWGSILAPSCQFSSVTPNRSSIASERRKPGVTATAV